MTLTHRRLTFTFNSPVVLTFALLCLVVLVLDKIFVGNVTRTFFSVYRSSLLNPLTYFRLFSHVLGHSSWQHFFNNMVLFLVLGPILEEKYGSANILYVILMTAFVTGIIHIIFVPYSYLLGASGVVFAFILLASMAGLKEGEIPITFILVAIVYLGQQAFSGLFVTDNISNLTHIVGGLVGSMLGYAMDKEKINSYV